MGEIRERFSQIADKKHLSYVEHNLVIFLLIMACVTSGVTVLGGYDDLF